MSESKKRKLKYRPGHFCQAEGCDNPLTMRQTFPAILKRGAGRFCSRKCRQSFFSGENHPNWKGAQETRICKTCTAPYLVYRSQAKWRGSSYCSVDCQFPNGGKKQRSCEVCGIGFFAIPALIKRGGGRFCSPECQALWQRGKFTGGNSPSWKGGKIKKACERCGASFDIAPSQTKKGRGRFCSRKCHGQWQSENRIGINSSTWRGGKSFEPYPSTFNVPFKRKIRARDNQTCALCGNPGRCVHHINYIKDDTTPENCITLCRSCHGKTGANREQWQAVFAKIRKLGEAADAKEAWQNDERQRSMFDAFEDGPE